jgi:hypothetical protein
MSPTRSDPVRRAPLHRDQRGQLLPDSFLAFGNAAKDGVDFRRMPRIAAEPFVRVVGEMLDLEEGAAGPATSWTRKWNPKRPSQRKQSPC